MKPPSGWVRVALGDVCAVSTNKGIPSQEPEVPFVGMEHVESNTGRVLEFGDSNRYTSSAPRVSVGTVLYGRLRPYLNKVFVADQDAFVSGEFIPIQPDASLDARFLMHRLLSPDFVRFAVALNTGDRPRVKWSQMERFPVNLPSLDEQRRIVAILEDHLSRLNAAIASIGKAEDLGRNLDESLLRGTLDEWNRVALGDLLIAPLSNGRSVPTSNDGFPVLRLTSLKDGWIDLDERKNGAWAAEEARPFMVKKGDFLVSRGNGSLRLVGRGGLVIDEPDPVAYPDTLIRIRADESRLLPGFLCLAWNSSIVRRQIESRAKTTAGIYKINQGDLRAIQVPVPPLDAQGGITERLAASRGGMQCLGKTCTDLGRRAAHLRRALLQAAFSGQLTKETSLV